jgi:hypothetical protein
MLTAGTLQIKDRLSGEMRAVLTDPAYRIWREPIGDGVGDQFTLETVWLDASRPKLVRGRVLVESGTLEECYRALPPGVTKAPDMRPGKQSAGILEAWW